MVEILKQKQYSPLSVGQQVVSILAGSRGLLDDLEVPTANHFIEELLSWMKLEASDYIDQINETGELDDELIEQLTEAISTFKMIYKFSFGK